MAARDMRKVAAHMVRNETTGEETRQAIVLLRAGVVVGCHAFTQEEPMTEWLGGTIILRRDSRDQLRAYHEGRLLG